MNLNFNKNFILLSVVIANKYQTAVTGSLLVDNGKNNSAQCTLITYKTRYPRFKF